MYSLYKIAKADFLQRIRSLAFLITIGAGIYLTFTFIPGPDANYSTVTLGNYQGAYNSSWIGTITAMMSSMFLTLFGFYLVSNSIERDYKTGVGQIIATTRTTTLKYITGKALSNFFVLLILMFIICLTATFLNLIYGEVGEFSALDLYLPFTWITIPTLIFISAFSVFTECFRKINRGIINIFFLFLFVFFVALSEQSVSNKDLFTFDLFGTSQAFELIKNDLEKQVSNYNGEHAIGYTYGDTLIEEFISLENIHPGLEILYSRLVWIFAGAMFILIGAIKFKKFDPAFDSIRKDKPFKIKKIINLKKYTSLPKPDLNFSLLPLVKAESKIMLKQLPVWWWFLCLSLFMATAFADLSIAHTYLLPILLLLQIGIWSGIGCREKINKTEQIIFTSPRVLTRQLFAGWAAAFFWALLLSSIVLIRLSLSTNLYIVYAIVAGLLFLPSLALISGIYTRGTKFFQLSFVILFYGLMQEVPFLDYLGTTSSALNIGMPVIFIIISLLMLLFSLIGRKKQSFM